MSGGGSPPETQQPLSNKTVTAIPYSSSPGGFNPPLNEQYAFPHGDSIPSLVGDFISGFIHPRVNKAGVPTTTLQGTPRQPPTGNVDGLADKSFGGTLLEIKEAMASKQIKETEVLKLKKLPHVNAFRAYTVDFKKTVALGSGRPEECLEWLTEVERRRALKTWKMTEIFSRVIR